MTVILVRHAEHDLLGRVLAGRRMDVDLNGQGCAQAERLAERLASRVVSEVRSSPRLRAQQTARPIARACGLPVVIAPAFDEMDFGEWAGRSFAQLQDDPHWQRWNAQRAHSRPPGGESMAELQERVVNELTEIAAARPGQCIVIVSHAEPIRAAVLHYRRQSLDDFAYVLVNPASVTMLHLRRSHGRLVGENEALDASTVPA